MCEDEYGDWLDKPLGGRKSLFATTQLSHLLERYMATVITTSLLTQNYTAAASSKLDEIDFTKAIKGEATLDKALEKYGEAVANGTPVEMMTVLIIPEWQKPGNMPKAIEELRHPTGGAQDSSFARGSPFKRPKKSLRFSDLGVGNQSSRGRFSNFGDADIHRNNRNSFSSAERDNVAKLHGFLVRVGGPNGPNADKSLLPSNMRPSKHVWEKFLIRGEFAPGDTPKDYRKTWFQLSAANKRDLIEHVRRNRDTVLFYSGDRRVVNAIGPENSHLVGTSTGPTSG